MHLSRDLKEDRSEEGKGGKRILGRRKPHVQRPCGGNGRGEDERLKKPWKGRSKETESWAKARFKTWASHRGPLQVMLNIFLKKYFIFGCIRSLLCVGFL